MWWSLSSLSSDQICQTSHTFCLRNKFLWLWSCCRGYWDYYYLRPLLRGSICRWLRQAKYRLSFRKMKVLILSMTTMLLWMHWKNFHQRWYVRLCQRINLATIIFHWQRMTMRPARDCLCHVKSGLQTTFVSHIRIGTISQFYQSYQNGGCNGSAEGDINKSQGWLWCRSRH